MHADARRWACAIEPFRVKFEHCFMNHAVCFCLDTTIGMKIVDATVPGVTKSQTDSKWLQYITGMERRVLPNVHCFGRLSGRHNGSVVPCPDLSASGFRFRDAPNRGSATAGSSAVPAGGDLHAMRAATRALVNGRIGGV